MEQNGIKISNWRLFQDEQLDVYLVGMIKDHPEFGTYFGRTGKIISFDMLENRAQTLRTTYFLEEGEEERIMSFLDIKEFERKGRVENILETIQENNSLNN
jgi:hypothetical protein